MACEQKNADGYAIPVVIFGWWEYDIWIYASLHARPQTEFWNFLQMQSQSDFLSQRLLV